MRKLKLEVDALAVESFETARTPGHTGTVQGRAQAPVTDPKNNTTRLWSCEGDVHHLHRLQHLHQLPGHLFRRDLRHLRRRVVRPHAVPPVLRGRLLRVSASILRSTRALPRRAAGRVTPPTLKAG